MIIRQALEENIASIIAIDSSATVKFGTIPALADLASDQESPEKIQQWLRVGRVYLLEADAEPLGFVAAHQIDSVIHIDEIAVMSDSQGKGIGKMLLNAVVGWAKEISCQADVWAARVTLTTYADVPWNGPWYRKFGFKEIEAQSIGSWLVAVENEEHDLVRPSYRRCCMLLEIPLKRVTSISD